MNAVIRAELIRLLRPRPIVVTVAATVAFAVVATVLVFTGAPDAGPVGPQGGTTLLLLAGRGGGTESFAVAASFVGFFIFVTFIALMAGEIASLLISRMAVPVLCFMANAATCPTHVSAQDA